jgi:N-acetylglucosamine-6-phosphate deacetylase
MSDRRFFDLQVNGYAGVDFNADDLTTPDISAACERLERDGVDGILATVITDRVDVMCGRIARLVAARIDDATVRRVIQGIHVEGPFLNEQPGFVGTHPAHAVQPATVGAAERLVAAGEGLVRLVTLAPERDEDSAVTKWLVDHGVRVAAGHCDPSLDELRGAIDNGLTMFTHLGNGCPLALPRHDNVIQRVLNFSGRLWVTFIADGVHVPFFALANYIRSVGLERTIVVSDAIAAAGLGPGEYQLAGQRVVVDEQLATWSADRSHLMGSATPMGRAYDNLVMHLGLSADEASRLTWHNPRAAMGLIAPTPGPRRD